MSRFSKMARAGHRDYELMSEDAPRPTTVNRQIVIRLNQLPKGRAPSPPVRKIMLASNEFWSESAEWELKGGIWRCISGTGALKRLVGMSPLDAKTALLKLGAKWEWITK